MQYDYLIVGQGLAGTLMAHRLLEAGQTVMVIDAPEQTKATAVAAGVINPITGRYFVKSWLIDELLPEARACYTALEDLLGIALWHALPLVRSLAHQGDLNQWEMRSAEAGYTEYMEEQAHLGGFEQIVRPAFGYGGIRQSARVDIGLLMSSYRRYLEAKGCFLAEVFDYQQLGIETDHFRYGHLQAKRLLFCEGWRAKQNPWFGYLPLQGMKGEILRLQVEGPPVAAMLKQQLFLVPMQDGTYWVGATNANQFADEAPSASQKNYLVEKISAQMRVPYRIQDHQAAVRPTVKDRRPLLGVHTQHKNMFIFNGLGTKGTSLGPLCSRWMLRYLLGQDALPEGVDIRRFS